MKRLHLQLQPARSPQLDLVGAITILTSLVPDVRVTDGEDDGRYINVDFKTADLCGLWHSIRKTMQAVPGLASATIIACEGEHGWADYLLLHHYDPQEIVDGLG